MTQRRVTILGATGSVGRSAADVICANPGQFQVEAVTAHHKAQELAQLAIRLNARCAVVRDPAQYTALKEALTGTGIEAQAGEGALLDAASRPAEVTLAAIVGMAGLQPLMAALSLGGHVAIANKEPLVAAGPLVLAEAARSGATLLPVDSEHNAIFQVFDRANQGGILRLILTASGGPFRDAPLERMAAATPEQAVAHPNWSMGAKISVDSATMMNKALEVIEAHHLFAMPPEKIAVTVHPQSVIHSMVEYVDGSFLAQLGAPDMRTPIANALGWPRRIDHGGDRLDWRKLPDLSFREPDANRFPAVPMAYEALRAGPFACLALNAANEVAVDAFLSRRIGFLQIAEIVRETLDRAEITPISTLEEIVLADNSVRNLAGSVTLKRSNAKHFGT